MHPGGFGERKVKTQRRRRKRETPKGAGPQRIGSPPITAGAGVLPEDRVWVFTQLWAWPLVLLGFVAAGGCSHPHTNGEQASKDSKLQAVEAIKACRGSELQGLDPDRIRKLLAHMSELGLKREYQDDVSRYGPWSVWDFGAKGQPPLYLLFEAGKKMRFARGNEVVHEHPHPSATPISMTLLDDAGKVISETHLTTGWRCYLSAAKLHPVTDNGYPLVLLETELGGGPGPDIRRQYYAWLGERFDVVRLENTAGKATRNHYYVKHFRSGPRVAQLTEAEWEADLMSPDRARMLRAMTWLGGFHWDLQADSDGMYNRSSEQPRSSPLVAEGPDA